MTQFYRLRAPGQPPGTTIVVAADEQAELLLRWVPNTGLWMHTASLENDYLFGDEDGIYEPITADQAAHLIHQMEPFDERRDTARRIMARYRALPTAQQRTNAEMGLTQTQTGMKPMSAPGLPELLRRGRRWRTIKLYNKNAGSAPRQFISEWSRRSQPLGLPGMKLRVSSHGQRSVVEAKATQKTKARNGNDTNFDKRRSEDEQQSTTPAALTTTASAKMDQGDKI
ncbi:hypothetical protein [Arthrobacter castelli]|uniref:hypothetical protein n=1 Tax=Arthrobacter castelli TaxID=271431 RepID=UPI0003FC3870|nr:hypothetical protein [Arthrobacter castelli]